ncbi:hypothetical protein F2P81_026185 [Scophthalmus maximus]|uniref:Uncharacterized protein n=1 Tax=Scophthalmus maximus TaxID=52904 RepID=A0A6A4RRA9_SCOMX|nr:hypothetical protein F2P81_026185 [Scophthalmus maximus]
MSHLKLRFYASHLENIQLSCSAAFFPQNKTRDAVFRFPHSICGSVRCFSQVELSELASASHQNTAVKTLACKTWGTLTRFTIDCTRRGNTLDRTKEMPAIRNSIENTPMQ